MKRIYLASAIIFTASHASAAGADCPSIKDKMARLACYDKTVTATPAPAVASAESKGASAAGEVFKSGLWSVMQDKDAMTDKKVCTAIFKKGWTLQGTGQTLFLSLRGRGGVKAVTLRVDDDPANPLRLATKSEGSISSVDFQDDFQRIYDGKRLRVQVMTVLGNVVSEDIDLTGFKASTDYIRQNCQA